VGVLAIVASGLTASCGGDEPLHPTYALSGPTDSAAWSQWGKTPGHAGQVGVAAQRPSRVLGSAVFDPFIPEERTEGFGDVLIHYQSPLVDGDDVFMAVKSGAYVACDPPGLGNPQPCGSGGWDREVWNEVRFSWEGGALVEKWRFASDWKPEPDQGALSEWEPVFHAALAGDYVVVPGAGGSVLVVRRDDGTLVDRVAPFAGVVPPPFVAGPLTVATDGSVYYDALQLDAEDAWGRDAPGAWLVRISPDGTPSKVAFSALVPGAPGPMDACTGHFGFTDLPWPPAPDVKPIDVPCGAQRPGVNVAPAIAPDGTVYVVSRAHLDSRYAYLVAANADLSPRWAASLRDRLDDGCGGPLLPPDGAPGGCRAGSHPGVDPTTNERPAGAVIDLATASPVVAPDGSVLYGAYTRYNYSRGHLMHFSAGGSFLDAYDFGWDVTPGIYAHDGTYSVVIKDNHYDVGSYCGSATSCPSAPGGPYRITQLDARLAPEWSFENPNQTSCTRAADGSTTCVADHPRGFEWCINAPAIDSEGTVLANGEDGVLYAIRQGGQEAATLFLRESVGAAYTPLSIDGQGRVYAENFGSLYVVGE
jgi:hypothetical protein